MYVLLHILLLNICPLLEYAVYTPYTQTHGIANYTSIVHLSVAEVPDTVLRSLAWYHSF